MPLSLLTGWRRERAQPAVQSALIIRSFQLVFMERYFLRLPLLLARLFLGKIQSLNRVFINNNKNSLHAIGHAGNNRLKKLYLIPVEPNPPAPLVVDASFLGEATILILGIIAHWNTIWAIRKPCLRSNGLSFRLYIKAPASPR